MSNSNSRLYYTSGQRDRRAEGQQLPPIRVQLPEQFNGPQYTTSTTSRNTPHNNVSQTRTPSYVHTSEPSRSRNNNDYNGTAERVYSSHSPEEAATRPSHGARFTMYNQGMVEHRDSPDPNFPSRHPRASSGDTTRRYPCDQCNERFDRPSARDTHMRTHTREQPFACNYLGCGKSFSVKSNLRRHEKTHTAASAFESAENNNTYSPSYSNSSNPSNPSSFYTSTRRF